MKRREIVQRLNMLKKRIQRSTSKGLTDTDLHRLLLEEIDMIQNQLMLCINKQGIEDTYEYIQNWTEKHKKLYANYRSKVWYMLNKDKFKKIIVKWRDGHKGEYNEYQKEYKEKNKDKAKKWYHSCYEKRYADPEIRQKIREKALARYHKLKETKKAE
jgi:hypothetical protein